MPDRARVGLHADYVFQRRPTVNCDRVGVLRLGIDMPAGHRRAVVGMEIGGRMGCVRVPGRSVRAEELFAVGRPDEGGDGRVHANRCLREHGIGRIDIPEAYHAFGVCRPAGKNIWLPWAPGQSLR